VTRLTMVSSMREGGGAQAQGRNGLRRAGAVQLCAQTYRGRWGEVKGSERTTARAAGAVCRLRPAIRIAVSCAGEATALASTPITTLDVINAQLIVASP
jgi:hypothetical protein